MTKRKQKYFSVDTHFSSLYIQAKSLAIGKANPPCKAIHEEEKDSVKSFRKEMQKM